MEASIRSVNLRHIRELYVAGLSMNRDSERWASRWHIVERDAYSALCVELCCTSEVQVTESASAASTAGQQVIQTVAVEPVVSDRIDGFIPKGQQRKGSGGNALFRFSL